MISRERALELFEYDQRTGLLTWKVNRRGRGARAGSNAGYSRPDGYISIKVDGVKVYAHRIAWIMCFGDIPCEMEIDHIDHDPSNNKLSNLRLVTTQGNRMNVSKGRRNKSGVIGVHWVEKEKRWCSQIRKDKRTHHLGYFTSIKEAITSRRLAQDALGFHSNHGE